jgi:hypothetical protein
MSREQFEAGKEILQTTGIKTGPGNKDKVIGISFLSGKFLGKDVTDIDIQEPKGFIPPGSMIYTRVQWQKRRQELLKIKLK